MVEIKLPEFFGVEEGRNSPIRLGEYVVADGLDRKGKAQVRIQSHIHSDHLNNWKHHIKPGKKLILTGPSKEILMIDESHIKRRATILTPEYDSEIKLPLENNDIKIRVLDAKHIPGSIQCSVEYQNGDLFGYSGDVGEDVDKIIQAEYLIMDTAYTKFKQGSIF